MRTSNKIDLYVISLSLFATATPANSQVRSVAAAPDSTYFVAPTGSGESCTSSAPCTLETARYRVRARIGTMQGDIRVILKGGEYRLMESFVLTGADSGANGHDVIYEAAPGATVTLSGGRDVARWTLLKNGIAVAAVPRGLAFRQVYVDDRRAIRARWPNTGFLRDDLVWDKPLMNVSFGTKIPDGVDWSTVEFVANRHWQQHRLRVAGPPRASLPGRLSLAFKADDAFLSFNEPGGTAAANQPFYFENALAFLDAPNEWFFDEKAGLLYLKVPGGRLPKRVIVPQLQTLLRLQGTGDAPVHNIVVRGIRFQHATWTEPSDGGLVPIQATWLATVDGARYLPAAAEVRGAGAHNIRFENNSFRHLGATGLALFGATREVAITRNRFDDLSAGALSIHSDPERNPVGASGSRDFLVADNVISYTGVDYTGSVGIFAGYVENARIEHNELHDLPYTAISIGWGWTDKNNPNKNNSISYNHIYRAMTLHDDGGGIYTLSKQPGTMIVGNYIHDLVRNPVAGEWGIGAVYLDNGSEGITVRDNAIERVDERIHLNLNNSGTQVPAKNNTIADYTGPVGPIAANAGPRPQ